MIQKITALLVIALALGISIYFFGVVDGGVIVIVVCLLIIAIILLKSAFDRKE